MQAMNNVLIVEDDRTVATAFSGHLQKRGYQAGIESEPTHAVARILAEQPQAVILDVNLPMKDGFAVCRELRPGYRGVILMVTSRNNDLDRVLGLELGADDYLVKPINPSVVEAHLKACLRRNQSQASISPEPQLPVNPSPRAGGAVESQDLDLEPSDAVEEAAHSAHMRDTLPTEQDIVRDKLELLELAKQLGNVSEACKMQGYSRDSYYRFKELYDKGGVPGLQRLSRKKPILKNRVAPRVEAAILALTIEKPLFGQVRVANELWRGGLAVSPAGVRGVWLRHGLQTTDRRLKALEAKIARGDLHPTPAQRAALEKARSQKHSTEVGGTRPAAKVGLQ